MIQIKPGDVIAFKNGSKYCYAVILTKIIMFGGNLVYTFHLETDELLSLDELFKKKVDGFNAIVDFIFAKREKRITKIGHIYDFEKYWKYRFFKATSAIGDQKPKLWFIYDENFKELKRVEKLSKEEEQYPLTGRIDDKWLSELVVRKWLPNRLEYWN